MPAEPQTKILNTALGDLLRSNAQARNLIMQSMRISPEELNSMIDRAGGSQMMGMTIGELFKNGLFQKAQSLTQNPDTMLHEFKDEHIALMADSLKNPGLSSREQAGNAQVKSQNIFQKIKNLFK